MKAGDKLQLTIEDFNTKGQGFARHEGMAIFVNGGLIGEECEVEITTMKKQYAIAKIIETIQPSPDEVTPVCSMAGTCGGCQIQHLEYKAQLKYKEQRVKSEFKRVGIDIEPLPIMGMEDPYQFRNKAQVPVSGKKGNLKLGFYKQSTHNVVDTQTCYIQHELHNKVMKELRTLLNNELVVPFKERSKKGWLKHVIVRVSFDQKKVMVMLVTTGRGDMDMYRFVTKLTKAVPEVASIFQNINGVSGNRILGKRFIHLYGQKELVDTIGDLHFKISPASFFQINPTQTEKLYNAALDMAELTGKETVYDLYCGSGTISLFLAKQAKEVIGIEIVEDAVKDAHMNAIDNNIKNASFYAGKVEEVFPELYTEGRKAEVVVVDPPRKGLDPQVVDTIVTMQPEKIVYVSCNPNTLARDVKALTEQGYTLKQVQPVDMFPHSMHVECCVKLSRI
jgi:23S rRNA (uracil1939-C5)-methyltransferase